jgi:intracellular septation protein A
MLLFGSAFVLHSTFARTFRQFGFRLPEKLWATLPSRIMMFLLGISFLFGAVDQLIHVH